MEQNFTELRLKTHKVFLPGTPISDYHLFAGRQSQMTSVINGVHQPGRHVILYGERGVGKTSLSKTLVDILRNDNYRTLETSTINCDETDDFSVLWQKVFRVMPYGKDEQSGRAVYLDSFLPKTGVVPDDIQYCLSRFQEPSIIVLDEVDQLVDEETKNLLAATLKNSSDHSANTTIILVGVADTVDELIRQHRSIERSLVQVRMPRMSRKEISDIIELGLEKLGMTIESKGKNVIVDLSQNLPFYAHCFGLYSALRAIDDKRLEITFEDVASSTIEVIRNSHNVTSAYHQAIYSPQKTNNYDKALLACALTPRDELGFFSATDVGKAMSILMGKKYEVPGYIHYLNEFCGNKRAKVLEKVGEKRRIRYRFVDPLMQPFVVINAFVKNELPLDAFTHNENKETIH